MRLLASFLIASLCGLMPLGVAHAETSEVEQLRAELAKAKAQLVEKEARIRDLEAREAAANASPLRVLAANGDGHAGLAPSSTLDWASATKVATAVRYMVPGSRLVTVMPTGSMKPVFDERSMLIIEPAPFDSLQVGDIVTYRHPRFGLPVVHRITEKRGDQFWSQGDNNSRADDVRITRENYEGRVFSIVYSKEPSVQAKEYAASH
jgi:signal peptidase I